MNYSEVLDFLDSIDISKENCAFDRFEETKSAFSLLDLKTDPQKCILIAGTNGKGTTSATLDTLIEATGNKVGLYTSPHLVSIRERMKVNSMDITEAEFIEAFNFINRKCNGIKLSHFEYLTLMAYYYFFGMKKVDYAIFEVGLGGLYDATNVIPHNTVIISKLGLDHEKYLGNRIEEIAENKFGIIDNPKEQTVIHMPFNNEVIDEKLRDKKPKKIVCSMEFSYFVEYEGKDPVFFINTETGPIKLALPGKRAVENTALAITAFKELGFDYHKFLEAISYVKWPCRMSKIIIQGKDVYLSGDHNPQGISSLIETLKFYKYRKIYFLIGIAIDKNYDQMLKEISKVRNAEIYITETAFKPRLINDYGSWLQKCNGFDKSWENLIYRILEKSQSDDMIICTGSLYLVGDILKKITR